MWIIHFERLADEIIHEIYLGTIHVDERDGIDQYGGTVAFDSEVVIVAIAFE